MERGVSVLNDSLVQIEKGLEHSFLYESDAASIHILLSILDHRHRYSNLKPKYTLMKRINTALRRSLKERKDREYVIAALRRLINDDVNRLEMAVVIDAYIKGYNRAYWVDLIERLALEYHEPDELSRLPMLFQNAKDGKAAGLRSRLYHELSETTDGFRDLRKLCSGYCNKVLRARIYGLNACTDKQIVLDFDNPARLKLEGESLTTRDLKDIYSKCNRYLYRNITKVYKEAFWNGINDAVLERYSG